MIKEINKLSFKYFDKEELLTFKEIINNTKLEKIKSGLEIKKRLLKYFAEVDILYEDASQHSLYY
jgi:hypothetical protein